MGVERIFIVTGSKGGGGKTPVALSLALAFEEIGIPTLACDFNFNNADLLTILQGTNVEERMEKGFLTEQVFFDERFWKITENLWLTAWNFVTKTGMPSTSQLWEKIFQMCDANYDNIKPSVIVIDTNLTLPLISPPLMDIQKLPKLPPLENWHLWSPSITLQLGEQERFETAISVLNRYNPGFEERLHHIFTPRHFKTTSLFGTLSSITKGEFNVSKKVRYKQKNPKPILFSELSDTLFASYLPSLLQNTTQEIHSTEHLLKTWLSNIIQQLEEREYRTSNVIVVPTVLHSIALLIEELTLNPSRTIFSIRKDLGDLYTIIKDHLTETDKDLILKLSSK